MALSYELYGIFTLILFLIIITVMLQNLLIAILCNNYV